MTRSEAEAEFMGGFRAAATSDAKEFERLDARIAELEAALFCALHGREIVVEPGEGGPVECVPLGENRVLWRRKKTKRG